MSAEKKPDPEPSRPKPAHLIEKLFADIDAQQSATHRMYQSICRLAATTGCCPDICALCSHLDADKQWCKFHDRTAHPQDKACNNIKRKI